MAERLEEDAHTRRGRRLDLQLKGMQDKLGTSFDAMWREAGQVFQSNKAQWKEGEIPSPYSLEEPDAVRQERLEELKQNKDQVNCNKLYQAIERWKSGKSD